MRKQKPARDVRSRWDGSRLLAGLMLVACAVAMQVFGDFATAGVVAITVIGLVSIGTARKRAR